MFEKEGNKTCFDLLPLPVHFDPFSMFSIYPAFGTDPGHPPLLSVALTTPSLYPSDTRPSDKMEKNSLQVIGARKSGAASTCTYYM